MVAEGLLLWSAVREKMNGKAACCFTPRISTKAIVALEILPKFGKTVGWRNEHAVILPHFVPHCACVGFKYRPHQLQCTFILHMQQNQWSYAARRKPSIQLQYFFKNVANVTGTGRIIMGRGAKVLQHGQKFMNPTAKMNGTGGDIFRDRGRTFLPPAVIIRKP